MLTTQVPVVEARDMPLAHGARNVARPHSRGESYFQKEIVMKTRLAAALVVLVSSIGQAQAPSTPASVNAQRMSNTDRDAANWLSYGRTYSEQRFSPLTRITADNAKQLGLAWGAHSHA
jgi:glucose dehydrogenase